MGKLYNGCIILVFFFFFYLLQRYFPVLHPSLYNRVIFRILVTVTLLGITKCLNFKIKDMLFLKQTFFFFVQFNRYFMTHLY